MNVYLVKTKDEREYVEPVLEYGQGPTFPVWPMAPVVAETPGRAKSLFIAEFARGLRTGVEADDYVNLRYSTLARNVEREEGVYEDDNSLWALAFRHELRDRDPGRLVNPNFLPHGLVITGDTADQREYEIEHPNCPVVCFWSPYARQMWEEGLDLLGPEKAHTDEGNLSCYVQWEVENAGLDSLDLGDDAPDDGTYVPESQWALDGWRRLPPGRYVIEPWFRQGQGLMPWGEDESEGGLTLVIPS